MSYSEIIRGGNFFARETVTIDGTAGGIGLTAATYAISQNGAQGAFITNESGQIRYTLDGTAPTTSVGHLLEVGDALTLNSADQVARFKGIRTGGTSGSLQVSYFRY